MQQPVPHYHVETYQRFIHFSHYDQTVNRAFILRPAMRPGWSVANVVKWNIAYIHNQGHETLSSAVY